MNDILQLKGQFEKRSFDGFSTPKLPMGKSISATHLLELKKELEDIREYWQRNDDIPGALVSVHYIRVIAKSNRISSLLSDKGKNPDESICGAKFVTERGRNGEAERKHVFTHYVNLSAIDKAINNLEIVAEILANEFGGVISNDTMEKIGKSIPYIYKDRIAKSNFFKVIVDSYFVESFMVDMGSEEVTEETIVTIYKTDVETKLLLKQWGINLTSDKIIDETTLLLDPGQVQTLYRNAPYLIAMSVTDFTKLSLEDINSVEEDLSEEKLIPRPSNEPIVGVIDTQFNKNVYFHEWVDYKNMLSDEIPLGPNDFYHGTAVSSIIVDGPKGNPKLDDGCGRFRVRHFGVATNSGFSSFGVLRMIREIVENNQDIKVWNLSLGSPNQIKENFVSPEAAELDRIQNEYDVIFVIAGTNTPDGKYHPDMRVGSPADSLNSIVVNSVNMEGQPASYSRRGPVLSFFHKPDVCYYGGDGVKEKTKIAVCRDDLGAVYTAGTSFAAPWVTRKMAYLINVMGLSREAAKALLIDATAGWTSNGRVSDFLGYGIVPQRIENVLSTSNDEIKFFITGTSEDYETYNYKLPVPINSNGKHPFYARAVMTYFPACNRNQGVDYTNTELDIHFGRVKNNGKLKTIDDNKQSEDGCYQFEEDARAIFRKWDNIKRICEEIKTRAIPREAYASKQWGISVISKGRVSSRKRERLPFGIVVTLKEMTGRNRIDEFIKNCIANGWIVSRLDVQNQIDVYNKAEEELEFE